MVKPPFYFPDGLFMIIKILRYYFGSFCETLIMAEHITNKIRKKNYITVSTVKTQKIIFRNGHFKNSSKVME